MNTIRRFQVPEGRKLTLPAELTEGTENTQVLGPETVDIDARRIGPHTRFIANRIALGDLVEIDYDDRVRATAGDHKVAATTEVTAPITTPATPAKE